MLHWVPYIHYFGGPVRKWAILATEPLSGACSSNGVFGIPGSMEEVDKSRLLTFSIYFLFPHVFKDNSRPSPTLPSFFRWPTFRPEPVTKHHLFLNHSILSSAMTAQEPNPGLQAAEKPADNTNNNHKMMLALIPKIPMMMRVALLHMLSLSKQSKYLDLRTEITIAVLRSFTNPSVPRSVSATQKIAAQAPALKGKIWVSNYTCPAPPPEERGLQDAIAKAIDEMRNPKLPPPSYEMPDPAPVEAEWTGYRANATSESRLPAISERELYAEMMKEVKSPVTILYFHGGAYYLLDPATHRATTKTLAKLTGGRVYSVRYRLAPQHPFPAALMDALMSYLALLYPPEGAFHEPVKPEHIVFAGDRYGSHPSHPHPLPLIY